MQITSTTNAWTRTATLRSPIGGDRTKTPQIVADLKLQP